MRRGKQREEIVEMPYADPEEVVIVIPQVDPEAIPVEWPVRREEEVEAPVQGTPQKGKISR